jgi:hypothetical protein
MEAGTKALFVWKVESNTILFISNCLVHLEWRNRMGCNGSFLFCQLHLKNTLHMTRGLFSSIEYYALFLLIFILTLFHSHINPSYVIICRFSSIIIFLEIQISSVVKQVEIFKKTSVYLYYMHQNDSSLWFTSSLFPSDSDLEIPIPLIFLIL